MARKRTMNYRELRADFDEDEERPDDEEGDEDEEDDEEDAEEEEEAPAGDAEHAEEGEEGEDEDAPPKKKKPKPKAKPKPKRTRVAKITRMRVVWGVFNNSNQKVATYDYPQKGDAVAHAKRLTEDKKSTHFVQPVKEPIEEIKEIKEK